MILREEDPEMSVLMVIIETGDYNNMVNQFYDFITSFQLLVSFMKEILIL